MMFRLNLLMAVMLVGVAGVLASTSATPTDPPPPTTTLTDEDTDTPTPTDTPEDRNNTAKEKGTNRVLNYGVVAGGAFGAYEYESDDYLRGYPYPLPQQPFLPAPNPGIPGLNPGIPGLNPGIPGLDPGIPGLNPGIPGPIQQGLLPPFPGAFIPTGSCKYYCPGRWHNQVYCCDNTPSFGGGFRCPRVRDNCPGKQYFRHVRFCAQDQACHFGELCCLDACIGRHVCKTPDRR